MNTVQHPPSTDAGQLALAVAEDSSPAAIFPSPLDSAASRQLLRMFRDPRVLEAEERRDLVCELRSAVDLAPQVAEIRVLLGMALAVDLQAQEALEQLRMAAQQAPDCFIAHLKYGELLMRLRICEKAAEETHKAAKLALNAAQSELARLQAEKIRIMLREGIERGGYSSLVPKLFRIPVNLLKRKSAPALALTK